MNTQSIIVLLTIIGVVFLLFIITRGIVLWYFKIDTFEKMFKELLELQAKHFAENTKKMKEQYEEQSVLQMQMIQELKAQNKALQSLISIQSPQSIN